MRIKTLIVLILSYGLVFTGFYTYLKSSQLREPLFLTHYYQLEIPESSADHIPIYYVTNQAENLQLVNVQSKAFPEQRFFVQHDSIRHQEGIYNQHEGIIRIDSIEGEEVVLDKLMFTFSNGKAVEADIGKIKLTTIETPISEERVSNFSATGSSNTGESYSLGNLLRDSDLIEISSSFEEILTPIMKLAVEKADVNHEIINHEHLTTIKDKVNLEDIDLPIKFKSGELLKVNVAVDKGLMYQKDIHALKADIKGSFRTNGDTIEESLIRITEQPYLTSKQIRELKEMREDGGE
jgi:hypothetical protein